MKKSKLLSCLLVFIMIVSMVTGVIPVQAATSGDYSYNDNGDEKTCTIIDYSGAGGAVTIPSTLGGLRVTAIGNAALNGELNKRCAALTRVTIPDGVTSIGEHAFNCCTNLTTIEIPASVTSIGGYAFDGCESLTSVTIPESVTSIEAGAFNGCTSLPGITIPASVTSIGNGAFCKCPNLASVYLDGTLTVEDGVEFFSGCSGSLTYY